jgi:hypothetical protein
MTPAANTILSRALLALMGLPVVAMLWSAWAQLAYAAGMGWASIAVPFSMIAFAAFAGCVSMARRAPCRARAAAFYLLVGILAVAVVGVVFHLLAPERTSGPWWLVVVVATVPAFCLLSAVAVYRLTQPRHEQVLR